MAEPTYILIGRSVTTSVNTPKDTPIPLANINGSENHPGALHLATDAFLLALQDFVDTGNFADYRQAIFGYENFLGEDKEALFELLGKIYIMKIIQLQAPMAQIDILNYLKIPLLLVKLLKSPTHILGLIMF